MFDSLMSVSKTDTVQLLSLCSNTDNEHRHSETHTTNTTLLSELQKDRDRETEKEREWFHAVSVCRGAGRSSFLPSGPWTPPEPSLLFMPSSVYSLLLSGRRRRRRSCCRDATCLYQRRAWTCCESGGLWRSLKTFWSAWEGVNPAR